MMRMRIKMKWRKLLLVKMQRLSPHHQTKPSKPWIRMMLLCHPHVRHRLSHRMCWY